MYFCCLKVELLSDSFIIMENQEKNNTNPVFSKNVAEMITVAHEYCVFLEKAEDLKKVDLLEVLSRMSALIYLKGSLIPDVVVEYPEANERFVTEETWEAIFNSLREKFGEDDEFFISGSSGIGEQQLVKASISEMLADVYQDMKDFVYLFQKPSLAAKENAVNEIKKLYKRHWGKILLEAQAAIHSVLYNPEGFEQEEENTDFLL